jgi:Tol biopolymer transport system component
MRRTLRFSLCALPFFFFVSCASTKSLSPSPFPSLSAFYVFRINPPALVELSPDDKPIHEIPISIPAGCALDNIYPSPRGAYLAMELGCAFGQTVAWINTDTDEIKQIVTDSDSHFLAWANDGQSVYLRVDSIGNPHILRANINGKLDSIPIESLTYDLAPSPDDSSFTFTFSRGMGFGSEMWLAESNGNVIRQLFADKNNIISFARWSPDGRQIAFIKIADSSTPFTVGELWMMNADGSDAHKLADADAGHGFPPAWSPDGTRLAFVVRENPQDVNADQNANALASNIYVVSAERGELTQLTRFQNARVEAPSWSPVGNEIAFTAAINDKMNVYLADAASGAVRLTLTESACCPAWLRK